jgi:hypothetical protein
MPTLDAILREPRYAPLQRHLATLSTAERVTLGAALLGDGLVALATRTAARPTSSRNSDAPMSDDGQDLDDYVSVPLFLTRTGLNKSLVYRLLRTDKLDGFMLDGTRKWVIHKHAHHALREKQP